VRQALARKRIERSGVTVGFLLFSIAGILLFSMDGFLRAIVKDRLSLLAM
jgi:hypothetical protein